MKLSPEPSETSIDELLKYCRRHNVSLSPKVAPKRVEGRGLGMYAVEAISKGERLIHVPTETLFTTKQIPSTFAIHRKGIPVHALLAAYFAFGDDQQLTQFSPWLATWPTLSDFTGTVPMLWKSASRCDQVLNAEYPVPNQDAPYSKYNRLTAVPTTLTGGYLMSPAAKANRSGSTMLVDIQIAKLESHIKSLELILDPETWKAVQTIYSPAWFRFVHMWLCINTRCFSYTRSGAKPPSDPNEAMALCPGMDLFNHAETPGVRTKYDASGYFSTAIRDHAAGEELVFSYGPHSNDVLWAEYGFLLTPPPSYDAIRIDRVVLAGLSTEQKKLLKQHGYLDDYWLTKDGVCWRTEVVAWLAVLSKVQWETLLAGEYDPEQEENSGKTATTSKRKRDGHVKAHRMICASWVAKVEADAAISVKELKDLAPHLLEHSLGEPLKVISNQHLIEHGRELEADESLDIAREQMVQRQGMCLKRWEQIRGMAEQAGRKIEGAV